MVVFNGHYCYNFMLFMLLMLSLWYHFTYVHPMLNGCNDNKKIRC